MFSAAHCRAHCIFFALSLLSLMRAPKRYVLALLCCIGTSCSRRTSRWPPIRMITTRECYTVKRANRQWQKDRLCVCVKKRGAHHLARALAPALDGAVVVEKNCVIIDIIIYYVFDAMVRRAVDFLRNKLKLLFINCIRKIRLLLYDFLLYYDHK